MSGICAIISFDGRPVPPEHCSRMAAAALHRAPDGVGTWNSGRAAFAHLRQLITPESVNVQQPLMDGPSGALLVADARIDNRDELIPRLRAELRPTGRPPTDEEIILAAYLAWGEECAAQLIGDFAFLVWDPRRERIFAARDAMGMRPLVYRREPGRLLIASEIGQILALPDVPADVFEPALVAHLIGHYDNLHWTAYEGVAQLPPAHTLVADRSGVTVNRYWDVDPDRHVRYRDAGEYAEHFREIFTEAVRCRLRSRAPVGILLSGGVDSGSVASSAGWLIRNGLASPPSLRAYSWAFEELEEVDERHISDHIVSEYGLEKSDVAADELWPLRDYPAHTPDIDDPFGGVFQALLECALSRARGEGMGLMLVGNRGDLLTGESVYDQLGLLLAGRWRELAQQLQKYRRRKSTSMAAAARDTLVRPLLANLAHPARPLLASRNRSRARLRLSTRIPSWVKPELIERSGLAEAPTSYAEPPASLRGAARRQRYSMVFTPLHMKTIGWAERLFARAGLGLADPWSDRRLAEFVIAIPQWQVQSLDEPKRLAREAMRGIMPEAARRTVGKTSPQPLWEKALHDRASETVTSLLTDSRLAQLDYADEEKLRENYRTIRDGGQLSAGFWSALTLEMWLRRWV